MEESNPKSTSSNSSDAHSHAQPHAQSQSKDQSQSQSQSKDQTEKEREKEAHKSNGNGHAHAQTHGKHERAMDDSERETQRDRSPAKKLKVDEKHEASGALKSSGFLFGARTQPPKAPLKRRCDSFHDGCPRNRCRLRFVCDSCSIDALDQARGDSTSQRLSRHRQSCSNQDAKPQMVRLVSFDFSLTSNNRDRRDFDAKAHSIGNALRAKTKADRTEIANRRLPRARSFVEIAEERRCVKGR